MRHHNYYTYFPQVKRISVGLAAVLCVVALLSGCPRSPQEQDEEPTPAFDCVEEAGTRYEALLDAGTAQEACEDIVDWLLAQSEVEDAGIASCGTTVWIHLDDGTSAALLTESFVDVQPVKHRPDPRASADAPPATPKLGATTFYMSPFRFQFGDWEEAHTIKEYYHEPFTDMQLGVEYVNEEVTVEALRGFLGMVGNHMPTQLIYSSHGGVTRVRGFPNEMGIIATGETVTPARSAEHAEDLEAGRLVRVYIPHVKDSYFCFTPEFVRYWTEYYNSRAPEDQWHWLQRYIYMSTCHSGHSSWPDAFIETGAVYYAGYEGKVYASFASQTGLEFFEYLTECETVWDAYTYTEPKTDPQTGGKFIVEQVGADVRVFYRGFFWWAGEALATSTHTWLSLGQGGLTGGTCVDVLNDFAGSLTIQLDSLEVGTQQIVEGSDAQISFFDVQNREWGANGTVMHEHNAPCGGQITVTELEPTLGTPVRFEIDATLVYTTDYENWEQKSLQGEFVAINFVDLGQQ